MRYIGIDYGSKKVGIAFSDEMATMGFPYGIITNTPALFDAVLKLIQERGVKAMVVGESRDFKGEENNIARDAKLFAEKLSASAGVPLFFESEILTTQEARRFPDGKRRNDHRDVDAEAAALILTSYFSHHDNH